MKYKVVYGDLAKDKIVEVVVDAGSVFDAIDKVSDLIDNPSETVFISAEPVSI